MDVFNLTNLELGTLFSTYGTVAFLSYIFGGVLADKYSPKKLLSFSLIFTSLGGFYMMSYPPYSSLQLLYAYWGFTTVFLFWAPMIKATSILGGLKKQGKTFSFLDAGRGIVASSIGLIILTAYMGYKITDIYSLYASEIMLFDEIEAARVGALQQYLRPLACISIAFFADKSGNINVIITGFVIMLIGAILFASGIVQAGLNSLFIISLVIVAVGTYIIRGLYFSILRDGGIPLALSGTAIGVVSIIGYTPDIFATPLYGYFLDTYEGIKGHQLVYLTLALSSLVGIYLSFKFKKINKL